MMDKKFPINNTICTSYLHPHSYCDLSPLAGIDADIVFISDISCAMQMITTCFFRTDRQSRSISPAHASPGYHGLCLLRVINSFL